MNVTKIQSINTMIFRADNAEELANLITAAGFARCEEPHRFQRGAEIWKGKDNGVVYEMDFMCWVEEL